MNYLIHSSLVALLLYGIYVLFLKKETFHQIKRTYLLSLPVLSGVLPLMVLNIGLPRLSFYQQPKIVESPLNVNVDASMFENLAVENVTLVSEFTWYDYSLMGYILISCIFLILLFSKVAYIRSLISSGWTIYRKHFFITRVRNSKAAFSFFNHIIIDRNIDAASTQSIIEHEEIHIKDRHSWDLMFYEILRVLFWFHPVAHLAQKELQKLHEYIVDQKLSTSDNHQYKEVLLAQTLGVSDLSLINSFNKSSILKNRITMLSKKKSSKRNLLKLLWMLPIVFGSLMYTACTDESIENAQSAFAKEKEIIDLKDFKEGQVDFFTGLTDEEISIYKNRKSFKADNLKDYYEYAKTDDGQKLVEILAKMNINGTTFAIDKENDNQLIKISEYENGGALYTDISHVPTINLQSEINKINSALHSLSSVKGGFDTIDGVKVPVLHSTRTNGNEKFDHKVISYDENCNEIVEKVIVEEVSIDSNEPIANVPFSIIDQVPVYPGCENAGTNADRKACMSEKISRYVNKEFNTGLANSLGLSGHQKINIQFKIDTDGNVVGVQSAASHPRLKEEAARVISSLPKMQPGMQRGQTVGVIYALPIIFQVQE
ncbi:MAG: M56 family metallopeptidase [Nonlabens sp.]